jgi:hypothetical protein
VRGSPGTASPLEEATSVFDSLGAIAAYRGWHALEQSLPGKIDIIDFDLIPDITTKTERFQSRRQVLDRIRSLRDSVAVVDERSEFIWAKLNASCYYLHCLEGQDFEFYEQVRNMLGKTPELIAEGDIAQQERTVFQLLEAFGVPLTGGRPRRVDFQEFADSIRIHEDAAEVEARKTAARLLPVVLTLLGFDGLGIRYRVELVKEDSYWVGWTSGVKGDFLLRFNFHSRHRWHKGDMEYLILHEVCGHLVHAAILAREIEEGRLDPFIGITTVHDPHAFMGEGIADALTYFFPDEIPLSAHAVLSREQRSLRDYLNNNAHILINMGEAEWELLGYLLRNPFTPRDMAELNLERWRCHALWRSYQYSYGIALKYHKTFASRMSREQRIQYLRYAFGRYVTPRRLIEYANSLMRS